MNRKEFRQMLKRYLKGTCTQEEQAWIDHWYTLLYDQALPAIGEKEFEELETEMWQTIVDKGSVRPLEVKPARVRKLLIRVTAIAAVLCAIVFGIWRLQPNQPNDLSYEEIRKTDGIKEYANSSQNTAIVELEDGSKVSLQPGSRISYPRHFSSGKREVYLDGDAFFEVTKNPARPFLVYNGRLVTQVLGTSFNVKMDQQNGQIEVSVRTGRVAVFENGNKVKLNEKQKKDNGVIITPNQKVVYKIANRSFTTSLVEAPVLVTDVQKVKAAEHPFDFDETPMVKVLSAIGNAYGIDIMVENENIYQCPFTGNLTDQPLYNKINLICKAIQATYEIKGTKILIRGKGCVENN